MRPPDPPHPLSPAPAPAPAGTSAPAPGSAPEISARLLRAVLLYFTTTYGRRRLVQVWEREQFQVPIAHAETPHNFLPLAFVERLLEVLTEASGDPEFVEKAGRRFATSEAVGIFAQLMRAFTPPRAVFRRVVELAATYTRVGVFRIERLGSDDLVMSHTSWVPERQRLLCRARMATFASVPTLWNLPSAQVRELRCQVEGAAACEYHLQWTDRHTGAWRAPLVGAVGGVLAGLGAHALQLAPPAFALGSLDAAGGLLGGWVQAQRGLRSRDLRLLAQQDGLVRSVQDLQQRNEEIFTENVQLEERVAQRTAQLTEANAQLQEALAREQEQYRRRSEFFDNLSHELRTPLTLILLTVETVLAEDAARLPAPVRQHLETLDRSAARLLGVINNLLDLARIESGKARLRYQPVELRSLLASLLLPFRVVAEQKRLSLTLVGEAVTPVEVDAAKMESVFQNLVSNALKFTQAGGVCVRVSEDEASVLVEVSDTGPGISAELLPVIFDRFALAESGASLRYKSTGIGLALVKETLELHQAHIEVASAPAEGTTFRVRLPKGSAHVREELRDLPFPLRRSALELPELGQLPPSATAWGLAAAAPPEEPSGASDTPRGPAVGARSLLLVEDDKEMRRFLGSILRQHYHVVEAEDGAQGLLLAQLDRPALIVSDVMMPVMSGLEMLQWLRNTPETADIPVILLTARQEVEARVSGLSVGANDYLGKPFSSRELLARIDVQLRLRDAAVRAAQNERLAATGMLTSGFAHEVRNPLNGLINALGPLRESLEPGGDPA
ncbi:MAG TPA: response regulator, partial [Aggregicoccus sp.]|nr:response regulator [Aggregicoccus sp.]